MRWPWSRDSPPAPAVAVAVPPTSFEGVTRDEVMSCGTGLYEVRTTDGVPVRLHDMSFLSVTFAPSAQPSLVLRFVYNDRTWTPEEAAATPVAVFTFGNAVVLQHVDEPIEPDTPASALGQVGAFDYYEATASFALSTWTTYLVFTASTLTLTLEADGGSALASSPGGCRPP